MINIISTIIVGFVVGVLARFFYPGAVDMGFWMTTLLGIGGSLLAGLVTASRRSGGIGGGFNRAGFFASLLGAIVLILLGRILL
jgi:uncharacterized membrane protein YeaQ/YmgE (transglycosylase-associated protein family)